MAIHEDIDKAWSLTIKGNTVAVISDGTAVLGLGDIGPEAAMPVMEGKALLFKEFAGVDAFPLCLATKDTESIVTFVKAVAPTFGAINLEDISAPRCRSSGGCATNLTFQSFHDDQHGTAIVGLAALMNALRVVEKHAEEVKVVVVGAGAAGTACTEILLAHGVRNIVVCDIQGALYPGRTGLDPARQALAARTNPHRGTRHGQRRAGGRRRTCRSVWAGGGVRSGRAPDGSQTGCLRDGQPGARSACGGRRPIRRDHCHGSF